MHVLQSVGYAATRSAASHGPWDVVGVSGENVLLLQAKSGQRPSPCDYKTLTNLPVGPGVIKLLAWKPDQMGQVRILYCADQNGPCDLPAWCASVRWLPGDLPKQKALRLT